MKLIHLEVERKRRQLFASRVLVHRMARALLQSYAVSEDLSLGVLMGYGAISNELAIARWIEDSLQSIDQEMADKLFPTLCDRFQAQLSRLPGHMHGGV